MLVVLVGGGGGGGGGGGVAAATTGWGEALCALSHGWQGGGQTKNAQLILLLLAMS